MKVERALFCFIHRITLSEDGVAVGVIREWGGNG